MQEYLKINIKNILPNILNEFDSIVITKNNAVLMVRFTDYGTSKTKKNRNIKSIFHVLRRSTNSFLIVGEHDNVTYCESASSMDALNKTLTRIISPLIAN